VSEDKDILKRYAAGERMFCKANLRGENLHWVNLHGANLSGADLSKVDLHGVKNIVSFGPVGKERRIGYAVQHDDGPRVQLGCFWGTLDEACAAIAEKYGDASTYEALVRAACAVLGGEREV
jgi:hypothetical protein